jgi:hypothetical protein
MVFFLLVFVRIKESSLFFYRHESFLGWQNHKIQNLSSESYARSLAPLSPLWPAGSQPLRYKVTLVGNEVRDIVCNNSFLLKEGCPEEVFLRWKEKKTVKKICRSALVLSRTHQKQRELLWFAGGRMPVYLCLCAAVYPGESVLGTAPWLIFLAGSRFIYAARIQKFGKISTTSGDDLGRKI